MPPRCMPRCLEPVTKNIYQVLLYCHRDQLNVKQQYISRRKGAVRNMYQYSSPSNLRPAANIPTPSKRRGVHVGKGGRRRSPKSARKKTKKQPEKVEEGPITTFLDPVSQPPPYFPHFLLLKLHKPGYIVRTKRGAPEEDSGFLE